MATGQGWFISGLQIVAGIILTAAGAPEIGVPLIISGVASGVANAIAPPLPSGSDLESSPTYGTAGASNATHEGAPKRIILGQVRTPPAYVSAITEQKGTSQRLKAALYVCDGGPYGIEEIDEIRLNDQPIEHYKDVQVTKLLGTATQTAPKGFEKVSVPYVQSTHLAEQESFTYTTKQAVDEIAVMLVWHAGLVYYKRSGGTDPTSSITRVEIRLEHDDGTHGAWLKVSPNEMETISAFGGPYFRTTKNRMGDGWTQTASGDWECRQETSAAFHNIIRVTLWGSDADVTLTGTGPSRVTIRLTNLTGNKEARWAREYDVVQVEEIVSDGRDYQGHAMLYVDALAQAQLSDEFFKIDCLVKGWKCLDPRTPTAAAAWTQNPAVQIYNVLLEEDVGAGKWITSSDVDSDSFEDVADVCEENAASSGEHKEERFHCDLVIDAFDDALSWITRICQTMRADLVEHGGQLHLVTDEAGTYARHFDARATPAGSTRPVRLVQEEDPVGSRPHLVLHQYEADQRPNVVRVQFRDATNDFKPAFTQKLGEDDLGTDEQIVDREIVLLGVTRATQAIRECRYWLNRFRLRPDIIELGVGLGDLDLTYGDVFRVSADYPALDGVDFQLISTRVSPGTFGVLYGLRCHADAYDDTDDSAPAKALSLTRSEALKKARTVAAGVKTITLKLVHR
jgi:hypothetical protein